METQLSSKWRSPKIIQKDNEAIEDLLKIAEAVSDHFFKCFNRVVSGYNIPLGLDKSIYYARRI